MTSVENTPSVDEIEAWVEKRINDVSHSCNALWRLVLSLDEVSMGVVGGYMDLEGQAMVRAFLASPEAMRRISRKVYDGKTATFRHQ